MDKFTIGYFFLDFRPLDQTRYFFSFRPIEVAPIGIAAFFSSWGIKVMLSEFLWVWLPLGIFYLTVWVVRKYAKVSFS